MSVERFHKQMDQLVDLIEELKEDKIIEMGVSDMDGKNWILRRAEIEEGE